MSDTPPTLSSSSSQGSPSPYASALTLYRQARFSETQRFINAALQAEPYNAQLWNLAGSTAKALKQVDAAERCWRMALALAPEFTDVRYNLGVLLQENERIASAITEYEAALAPPAWQPQALNNLGSALARTSRLDDALRRFDEALKLQPDYSRAHHNRGRALAALGRFGEAEQALRSAIAHAKPADQARYYRTLAFLHPFIPGDPLITSMETLTQDPALDVTGRLELDFALGKAYDDVGERPRAFAHWIAGNRAKRAQVRYDEVATLTRLEKLANAFTSTTLAARKDEGSPSTVPVFVVGMPRSGSTLVEQILASHPEVYGAGECEDFRLLAEPWKTASGRALLPDGIDDLPGSDLAQLGETYLRQLRARAPLAGRIIDKNLYNFQLVGLIHLALPKAVIIHTRRDPVDTCLSCFARLFHGEHPYSYDLAELGRYWQGYDRLMAHWRRVLPAETLLELDYEGLVADQEGQSRRLLAHCGLEWSPAVLNFHSTQRPVFTASATQVREPIYRRSIQKWQAFGPAIQPLIDALQAPP